MNLKQRELNLFVDDAAGNICPALVNSSNKSSTCLSMTRREIFARP
jgi:hypothetical protein